MKNRRKSPVAHAAAIIVANARPRRPGRVLVAPDLHPLIGIRAVLFDVYGTLLHVPPQAAGTSHPARALATALSDCRLAPAPDAGARGMVLFHDAIHADHKASRARGVAVPEVEIRRIWRRVLRALLRAGCIRGPVRDTDAARLALAWECRANPAWPMPGAAATLLRLREAGLKLGIVSNAQFYTRLQLEALLGRRLDQLGLDDRLCAWSFEHGTAKPGLELWRVPLLRLQHRYGIKPHEVLAVGNDLRNDVAPPARLGCRTAWFAREATPAERPAGRKIRPDVTITRLAQLLPMLQR